MITETTPGRVDCDDDRLLARMNTMLGAMPHGVLLLDRRGQVTLCTKRALELLHLPEQFGHTPYPAARLIALLDRMANAADNLAGANPKFLSGDIFTIPPDRFVRLTPNPIADAGTFILIEDISEQISRERARLQAESEYRSLFDNAVYGVYRDHLDGTPIRANPALAKLNGYGSEAEHIEAVASKPQSWYVDPNRPDDFMRLIAAQGRVTDLVSEVYRHRTREKIWITENAWYVRDAAGKPIFIEGTILDATERVTNHAAIERQANIDSLTGAANRFRFMRQLGADTAPGMAGCVLYTIDLDHFKEVNDSIGHAAGDVILKTVAERLQSIAGSNCLVARLGGDEFAILAGRTTAMAEAAATAQRIVQALCQPIDISGRLLVVGASVGVAVFPDHAVNGVELLRNSDLALYEAKSSGRNGYRFYDAEFNIRIQRRKDIVRELRTAAAAGGLEVHYQPVVNSLTGSTVGFEALMRWNHPVMGNIPPGVFIPIAEEAGLMTQLGAWVITRACEDLALLPSAIKMGINVSASQFRSPDLLAHIKDTIRRTGISPSRLVFEITESVLVSNAEVVRYLLEDLRQLGAQIALDDFGTGYSSLSYLQQFPITMVKIDRSFFAGMGYQKANQAVIRAVMGIGREMDIDVVAEGIETIDQVEALQSYGCHIMQGYYFGKATPLTDIIADVAIAKLGAGTPGPDTLPARSTHGS